MLNRVMNMSIAKPRGTTALAAAVSCIFGLAVVDCAFAQMGGGMCRMGGGMGARMGGGMGGRMGGGFGGGGPAGINQSMQMMGNAQQAMAMLQQIRVRQHQTLQRRRQALQRMAQARAQQSRRRPTQRTQSTPDADRPTTRRQRLVARLKDREMQRRLKREAYRQRRDRRSEA